jgi:hypothetical protein
MADRLFNQEGAITLPKTDRRIESASRTGRPDFDGTFPAKRGETKGQVSAWTISCSS